MNYSTFVEKVQISIETVSKLLSPSPIKQYYSNPEKVIEYRNGKSGLLGLFMGEVMKLSKGKADPKVANDLVKKALEQSS